MSRVVDGSYSVSVSERTRPIPAVRGNVRGARTRWSSTGNLALAVTGVALLAFGVRSGMSAISAISALLTVAFTQVLPGALCWRAVRPRHGWWVEDLAMGFAIGSAIAVAAQVLAGMSGLTWLAGIIGPLVGAALLAVRTTRRRVLATRTSPLPAWWGLAVAASSLVAIPVLQAGLLAQPLTWPSGVARSVRRLILPSRPCRRACQSRSRQVSVGRERTVGVSLV